MCAIPFQEKKTVLRGILDVVSGAYPGFVFGGGLGHIVPIFHFHDITPRQLEPQLLYLAENGYSTLVSDELEQIANHDRTVPARSVALSFDDAWASLWTIVLPLLKKYGMHAISYVAPGRIEDACDCREQVPDDRPTRPALCTWPELLEIHRSGLIDIQAHSFSHSAIFSDARITGFVNPQSGFSLLSWPAVDIDGARQFLGRHLLGHPLYETRSRMSDAYRYLPDESSLRSCLNHVAENGGENYFSTENWDQNLLEIAESHQGRYETADSRKAAIIEELLLGKEILEKRLGKRIEQICMPWAVCGKVAESLLRELGYKSAVADILYGRRYLHSKTNPFRIMRLKNSYIACLPGKGRKSLLKLN
jgi:peptidoglycan/xylan/chitin deacetylase (PgdA/CDA1 family)